MAAVAAAAETAVLVCRAAVVDQPNDTARCACIAVVCSSSIFSTGGVTLIKIYFAFKIQTVYYIVLVFHFSICLVCVTIARDLSFMRICNGILFLVCHFERKLYVVTQLVL